MRRLPVWLLVALLGVAAGCGGESDEDQVAGTIETYFAALADGDGQEACAQLTGPQNREVLGMILSAGLPVATCADAVTSLSQGLGPEERERIENAEATNIQVDGDFATAEVEGGTQEAELTREGDRWLIAGGLGF